LGSLLKASQFASDLIHVQILIYIKSQPSCELIEHQVAVNFNVRLSQFKKNKKKNPYMMGLSFLVFSKKTGFNRTGPVRLEPVSSPVQLIFIKNTKI